MLTEEEDKKSAELVQAAYERVFRVVHEVSSLSDNAELNTKILVSAVRQIVKDAGVAIVQEWGDIEVYKNYCTHVLEALNEAMEQVNVVRHPGH